MRVIFYNEIDFRLAQKKKLKIFIESIFEREGRALDSLAYIFCSDNYLLNINRQYLDHDYFTDIISFDLSETPKSATIGEIYISIDRVKDNAQTLNVPFQQELHRVIFHGALHLCGYKDKTKSQQAEMRKMENNYLSIYGLL